MHAPLPSRSSFARLLLAGLLLLLAGPGLAEENARGTFSGAKETVYPDWFKVSFLDFEEDIAEAAAAGRRYLLFIHQDGCPYCNKMVEVNLAEPDIARLMQRRLDVVALNMWGDRDVVTLGGQTLTEKAFARVLKVQFTPTLIFFNERGQVILRLNGYLPPDKFRIALDYVLGHHEKRLDYRRFVAERSAVETTGELVAEPFFTPPPYDLAALTGEGRPLAVFFEQRGCAACVELHEKRLADPTTRALVERFHAVQLDMWSETPVVTPGGRETTARAWADALGVGYAPTVVLFDADGEEVIRSEAWFRDFHTESLFDYVASGGHRDEPSFQRYLSARAEAIMASGRDVDIWK